MKFNGITKKGREYLAKIQAENKPINFSKIKIGDGRLDNYDNPAELELLINQKVEKGILTLNQENDTVILTTNIDNVSLRTGYYPREIGVFVNDNGQEIMYYYMNDGDETSWIPPETDGPFKIELKLNLIASNAQSIIVEGVGKDLFITKEFLETNYTQKGGYTGTAQEIDDRVVAAVGKEDGKFPLTESVVGNIYYFPGNKKFYICKEAQNRRVSVPDGNFEEISIWENRKKLENLSIFKIQEFFSIPSGIKFTVYQYGNLILITAYTYNVEFLAYGVQYKFTLPFNCYDNSTAITGNYGTCGHFTLRDNVLIVNSTDSKNPLKNSFMGQMVTFLK